MSDITKERFENENRSKKHRVSRCWADLIYLDLPEKQKTDGISVHSLVGPNVTAHCKEYEALLGRYGKLHIYEQREDIHRIQKRSRPGKRFSDRFVIHPPGDFFELCPAVISSRAKYTYLDIDMCITYESFRKSNGLWCVRNLSSVAPNFKHVWMCLTFCIRNSRVSVRQMRNEIIRAWKIGNLKLRNQPAKYRDGAPMVSMLFHCER